MRSDASLDDEGADPRTRFRTEDARAPFRDEDAPAELRADDGPTEFRVDDAPYRHRYDDSSSRGRLIPWWVLTLAAIVIGLVGYYYWLRHPAAVPATEEPAPRAQTAPAPSPEPEPAIQHPIEAAKPDADLAVGSAPLPALDASDRSV